MNSLSILTNRSTRIHVFRASLIPKPPGCPSRALRTSNNTLPSQDVLNYVSALYYTIDKGRVPDVASFQEMAKQAVNVKRKYEQLKDLRPGNFYDLIVRVVRRPYDLGDSITIWVTDYTENPAFYHFSEEGSEGSVYGEPMGYANTAYPATQESAGAGPVGKMSMQITCWEPHATVLRTKAKAGSWVSLRNVQVKYGRNNANLEGYLREDRRSHSKVGAEVLDHLADGDTMDQRLKNAIRRKYVYERNKNRQPGKNAANQKSKKRRAEDDESTARLSCKVRRVMERANKMVKERESQEVLDLNPDGK